MRATNIRSSETRQKLIKLTGFKQTGFPEKASVVLVGDVSILSIPTAVGTAQAYGVAGQSTFNCKSINGDAISCQNHVSNFVGVKYRIAVSNTFNRFIDF